MTDADPLPETTVQPVILSGGIGARLWPASRRMQPKQLSALVEVRTMIHATVDRLAGMEEASQPIIVTNSLHADAIGREMTRAGRPNTRLILEPSGRNTAPAVAVAAHEAMKDGGDPLLLILPSDHTISAEDVFVAAVRAAARVASTGYLITFGIEPSSPETGFGYIKVGGPIDAFVLRVAEFREKPDAKTAAGYIESGNYLWNAGMFLFNASTYLTELETHAPDIARLSRTAWERAERSDNQVLLDAESFGSINGNSIDYAVMEATSMAAVVPTDPGWSDVGSWASLWDIADKDPNGNAIAGDVIDLDVTNSYVSASNRLVAAVGLDGVVIVDTPDALLVAGKADAQDVKKVVDILAAGLRRELETNGFEYRPWGTVRPIASGPGYRIRHLSLDLGAETPMKSHETRTKHWLIVRGGATITTGEASRVVSERESVLIEPGVRHQVTNSGDGTLEVIEVAVEILLEEQDVERFLGVHGRLEKEI